MPKNLLLALVLFFTVLSSMGQERLWTKQTSVSAVIAFEKEINPSPKFLSQNVSLAKDYYPLSDKYECANPVIIQREPVGYLPLYAEYFFTPVDSILRLISYDWEKDRYGNFFDKQKMWAEESKKFEVYDKEYERIKKTLLSQLGEATASDMKAKEVSSGGGKYLARETVWDTNELKATLSMVFASSTYRIRLKLYWKK